jgi:chromosomal replication initiation ATPase DnaA
MSSQNSVSSVEEAIWSETLSKLQGQMTKGAFDSVMQKTNLVSIEDDIYIVQVAAPSAKEWLENRWRAVVERALSSVIGVKVKVSFRL